MGGELVSAGKPLVFVDTCVWLDLFLLDRPGRKDAEALIHYALDNDVPLVYASHSALDVYAKVAFARNGSFGWRDSSPTLRRGRRGRLHGIAPLGCARLQRRYLPIRLTSISLRSTDHYTETSRTT